MEDEFNTAVGERIPFPLHEQDSISLDKSTQFL